jgi:hypothetical protein
MRSFLLLAVLASAAGAEDGDAPARPPVKAGGRGTVGSSGYAGRSGFVQLGDAWKARFSYSDFSVDGNTDTTRTYSGRLSYQGEALFVGVNAAVTPRANHYSARSAGADLGWAFLSEDEGAPLEEWELSAWWTRTTHTQGIPSHPVRGGQPDQRTNQDDYGGGVSATAFYLTASFDGYASFYDKRITRAAQFARNRPPLAGISSLLDSFPENALSARLEYDRWRACVPHLNWAKTTYATTGEAAFTYGGGATLAREGARLELSYETVRQRGSPASGYFTFAGSWLF